MTTVYSTQFLSAGFDTSGSANYVVPVGSTAVIREITAVYLAAGLFYELQINGLTVFVGRPGTADVPGGSSHSLRVVAKQGQTVALVGSASGIFGSVSGYLLQ